MVHHIRRSLAWHYHNDAREFLSRYSLLRPEDFTKSGRVKNFVDVLLAAECALKAHIFLGGSDEEPLQLFKAVKRLSHRIEPLAARADFLQDRSGYSAVAARFDQLTVDLRYSLDMWETFFPALGDNEQVARYDKTVANTDWRVAAVAEVQFLVNQLTPALNGENGGGDDFFDELAEMAAFVREAKIIR